MANLNVIRYTAGSQRNCLSRGSDGEKRGELSTKPAKQLLARLSLYNSILGMLFSRELHKSSRLLVRATDIVITVDRDTNEVYMTAPDELLLCSVYI